jgi:tetratricopeptide (TPR) repeat protein
MPPPPDQLVNPPLRKKWSDARKAGEAAATTLKQTAHFTATRLKMKGDLGPDLEAWPKLYPDYGKLKSAKEKIDATIKMYSEAVSGADKLDKDKVRAPMLKALKEVKDAMQARLTLAEKLIESDEKLAIKDSLRKQIKPIVIFNQDVGKQVSELAGKGNATLEVYSIPLEVILADPEVLKHVPNDLDDAKLAVQIRNAADFHGLLADMASALVDVSKTVKSEKDVAAAEKKYYAETQKLIEAALKQASGPILQLAKVKVEYRNYKIKAGVQLGLTVGGIVGSAGALLSAPITNAAGVVVGLYGLVQASISLGTQIAKLIVEAEDIAGKVSADLKRISDQYKNFSKTAVGTAEVGTTLANALLPAPVLQSITGLKGDCDLLGSKVQGLIKDTHQGAQDLGKLLTKQTEAQTALSNFEKISKGKLTGAEIAALQKAMKAVDALAERVDASIKTVDELDKREIKMVAAHKRLSDKVTALASKKPNWAEVGELVVGVAVSAGFLAAGNTNLPDAFKGMETFNTATTWIGNSTAMAATLRDTVLGIKDQIEKRKG